MQHRRNAFDEMDTPMANGAVDNKAGSGPSITQLAAKHTSSPVLERALHSTTPNGHPRSGGINDEAADLLLNVSSGNDQAAESKMVIAAAEPVSPPRKNVSTLTSYLHTPPDDPVPGRESSYPPPTAPVLNKADAPSASAARSNKAHTPASDQAGSPAQSTTGSSSKPRTKRKRNAIAGPSRQPAAITPPVDNGVRPDHYLGEDNSMIRCICGYDDDDGFTIQCEHCGAWEHGLCFGYVDEESAPDKFFCEMCVPRPVNRAAARELQEHQRSGGMADESFDDNVGILGVPGTGIGPGKPAVRTKGKRPRSEAASRDESKDPSPGAMKPPSQPKPKRRPAGNKPRIGKQSTTTPAVDATPTQPVFKEPTIPTFIANTGSNGHELDDDYFRVKPWLMEYTPVKGNVVRGKGARQAMRKLYLDWADDDQDEVSRSGRKRSVDHTSGLPSPTETGITRLSPEAILPHPDFSTLAPPVPPVTLYGDDLESQSASVLVKIVRNAPSFLPLSYSEVSSTSGVYSHPSLYGLFADERLETGSFIGEYRGEVVDCETYRKDPINQYAGLGMPKPFVRSMGPPVDLMIDCRGYGTDLRFIRSSCHPNAVLRPIVWRPSESDAPRLRFGVFATTDIYRKEEIVLPWEWDDHHVVHALQSIIQATTSSDGSVSTPDILVRGTVRTLAQKFDTVLTTLYGAFSSCACRALGKCALAQMKYIVDFSDSLEDRHSRHHINGKRSSKADLGELVGAMRGWRRKELEQHGINQGHLPNGHGSHLVKRDPEELERLRADAESRSHTEEASEDRAGEELEVEMDTGGRRYSRLSQVASAEEARHQEASDDEMDVDVGKEEQMEVDEPQVKPPTVPASSPLTSLNKTPPHVPPISQTFTTAHGRGSGPANAANQTRARTFEPGSSLTPPSASDLVRRDAQDDDGDESDATTITQPRTVFSEDEEEVELEESDLDEVEARDPKVDVPIVPSAKRSHRPFPKAGILRKPNGKSDFVSSRLGSPPQSNGTPPGATGDKSKCDRPFKSSASLDAKQGPKAGRKKARASDSSTGAQKADAVKAEPEARARATVPDQTVAPLTEPEETVSDMLDEVVVKELEEVVPPKEPTPPPRVPTPPPPRRVPLAEYLKSRQSNQGILPPIDSPAFEVAPTASASLSSDAQAKSASPAKPESSGIEIVVAGNQRDFPVKQPTAQSDAAAPATTGPAGSPSVAKVDADSNPSTKPFNFSDYLPSKTGGASVTTPAPMVESPATTVATPGPGLTTRDYFPPQPVAAPSTPQVSSSYVPRKSSSYVPRSQSQSQPGSMPVESPSVSDYLPPPPPPPPSSSSSYVPRPSPRSETSPLPPAHGQSSSYLPRHSPYRPSQALPEVKEEPRVVSIPPPAAREPPPHAQPRAPPTGPKVPPTGPRTSGGSAGDPYLPPRDRDWDSRDRWERERDRDRDRDWDRDRERDRDRDRDRDPVSPRAVFSVGSARGGAPVPVPFHRGRGGGRGGGGFRGGPPRGGW